MTANRPLQMVFCVPGRTFSGRFLDCWTSLLSRCHEVGINYTVSREYDPVVYYARNRVLHGNLRLGSAQQPWQGKVPYDFMLWIDSDIIFTFEDFVALLQHNVDVVSGLYLMQDGQRFATVEQWDEKMLQADGEMVFMTKETAAARQGLVTVGYTGLGFMLVKRGVFEKLPYPWFRPVFIDTAHGQEFTSEDVGFCLGAAKAGIAIQVDPKVIVGHEKAVVLRPA